MDVWLIGEWIGIKAPIWLRTQIYRIRPTRQGDEMKARPTGPIEMCWSKKPEHLEVSSEGRVLLTMPASVAVLLGHSLIEMGAEKGFVRQIITAEPRKEPE